MEKREESLATARALMYQLHYFAIMFTVSVEVWKPFYSSRLSIYQLEADQNSSPNLLK